MEGAVILYTPNSQRTLHFAKGFIESRSGEDLSEPISIPKSSVGDLTKQLSSIYNHTKPNLSNNLAKIRINDKRMILTRSMLP